MSASHFDDLLGDFGETTTTTHKTSSHGVFDDSFDPFAQSYQSSVRTQHVTNSELLLDFADDDEIQNGEISGGVDHHLSDSDNNHFYKMSTDTKSANQYLDFGSGSANPLYDLSSDGSTHEPSNPLYEFTSETKTTTEWPNNPLYDTFGSDDGARFETREQIDVVYGTDEHQEEDVDYQRNDHHHYDDSELQQEEDEEAEEKQLFSLEQDAHVLNGDASHWVEQPYEIEEEHHHHEPDEDSRYSPHVEVVEEDITGDELPEDDISASEDQAEDDLQENEFPKFLPFSAGEISETLIRAGIQQDDDDLMGDTLMDVVPENVVPFVDDSSQNVLALGDDAGNLWSTSKKLGDSEQELYDTAQYCRDRAEEDLENYCMDREESDVMDDPEDVAGYHVESVNKRGKRSSSSSWSSDHEARDTNEPSNTPDTSNDADILMGRIKTSRSLQPGRQFKNLDTLMTHLTISSSANKSVEDVIQDDSDAKFSKEDMSYITQANYGEQTHIMA